MLEWHKEADLRKVATAVLEHRRSENTLDGTNVKGKL